MPRFRSKKIDVGAEQYISPPDIDNPDRPNAPPPMLCQWKQYGQEWAPVVLSPTGHPHDGIRVNEGQWIVCLPYGNPHVMSDFDFQRSYSPIGELEGPVVSINGDLHTVTAEEATMLSEMLAK